MYKYMVTWGYDIVWNFEWEKRFTKEEWTKVLINFWKYPRTQTCGCFSLKEVNQILKENKMYYTQYVVLKSETNEIVKTNLYEND